MKRPVLTLDASIVQDDQPLEVVPKVYVGSIHSAFNIDILVQKGITHILNASRIPGTFPKEFTYLSVEIRDKDDSNLLACIPTTNIFIEAGIDHGGILVHCFGGKSRSPAFICAYLMSSCSWTFDAAYNVVKTARPSADINIGFECQLRAYEAARYDVYIAQQLLLRARIRDLHLLKGDKSLIGGQFVPIMPPSQSQKDNVTSDSTVLSSSSAVPVSVPMFLSAKQQRFDSVSAAEHWQLDSRNPHSSGPNSGQKRALDRGRSALGAGMRADSSTEEATSSSMDVDNHTDGEESSVYRSPLGKAPSRNLQDDSAGNNKALKTEDRSSPSTAMVLDTQSHRHAPLSIGGNSTALEDSVDSQMSKDSTDNNSIVSMSSAPKPYIQPSLSSIPPSSASSYSASNDFVQSLSTVPVNFHTGSGGSGGKTSRHRRGGGGGGHHNHGGHSNSSSSHGSHGSHHNHHNLKSTNKNPSCRLSRPGSNWVRVIPPLRGLEREFKCAWCNCVLFQLSSVIRQDINVAGMIDEYLHARQQCFLRQLTTDPALREDPEEQFLKSRSSSSGSGGSSSGGGSKEKFNDKLMAALKKSTSNLRLAQMQTTPSSSSSAAGAASNSQPPIMLQESHFLPPINSGGGYFVSASAPASVARHPINNQRSHSRGFHEPSTAMDVGDEDEDEDDEEARMPSYPMPLMTTRHAKSQAKGFDFADSPPSSSSASDTIPPSLSLSKPTSFGRNHQNNSFNINSSSNAATQSQNRSFRGFGDSSSGSTSAPTPSSAEKLFTPRQTSQSHLFPSSLTVAGPATSLLPPPSTTTLSLSSGSGSTHSSPRIPVYSNNTTNMLLPSISVQQTSSSLYPIPSGGSSGGSSGSESTPPPTLHTLSTGSLDGRSQSSSPRIPGIVLTSTSERQPSHNALTSASSSSSGGGGNGGCSSGRMLPRISPRNLPALENANGDRPNSAGSNNGQSSASAPATTTFRRELMPMTAMAPYTTTPTLGSRSAQNPNGYDESPRVLLPPAKMFEGWSAHDRPRSAEKVRWYARANLLKEGDTRVASIAEADDVASQLAFDQDPYFHIEYLEWMGKELFCSGHEYDHGELCCPGCRHVVGSWTWTPSVRLTRNGTLEAPLFRISKSIVHHTDLDFDATPSATPRLSEDMSL